MFLQRNPKFHRRLRIDNLNSQSPCFRPQPTPGCRSSPPAEVAVPAAGLLSQGDYILVAEPTRQPVRQAHHRDRGNQRGGAWHRTPAGPRGSARDPGRPQHRVGRPAGRRDRRLHLDRQTRSRRSRVGASIPRPVRRRRRHLDQQRRGPEPASHRHRRRLRNDDRHKLFGPVRIDQPAAGPGAFADHQRRIRRPQGRHAAVGRHAPALAQVGGLPGVCALEARGDALDASNSTVGCAPRTRR